MKAGLLTALLVAGSAGLGFVPLAAAAPAPTTLAPTVESWYQAPGCTTPAGCLGTGAAPVPLPAPVPSASPVAANPFPAGTLHVGVSGGQETARTYLGLDAGALAGGVTRASLLVPLDVERADGSLAPEQAKLQVCLTEAPVPQVEGAADDPPAADCARTAAVKVLSTPTPHLEADLGPLLAGLPGATALVLLPDATALAPTDAWRLVFSARSRKDAGRTGPATLTVVPAEAPSAAAAPTTAVAQDPPALEPAAPAPQAVAAEPELGAVQVAAPPAVPAAPAPQAAPEQPAATEPVAFPQTITVGYAYPVVWLVPLALLVVVPLVTRALTQDLTPRDHGPGSTTART